MPCHKCHNQNYFSGSHHIGCNNPPLAVGEYPNASPESREKAKKGIAEMLKLHPDVPIVIRCIWGGSGTYPVYFDPNTVLACSNHNKKGENSKTNPLYEMLAILKDVGRI